MPSLLMIKKYQISFWVLLASITCIAIYYPGLSGGFMMDDKSNLSPLRVFNGEFSWDKIKEYIGLSKSGVLKRPISVLSFLTDSNSWPTSAWSFKRTNVFIHIFNSILLFTLYYKLFHNSKKFRKDAFFIASISMALWMFHPFLVSSVLYIVQRMAMLAATFVLLGLLSYTIGRTRFENSSGNKGLFLMLIGMYVMPVFAVLSKENGILLVYFILLVEIFVFRQSFKYNKINNRVMFWLYLPPLLTTFGLISKLPSFINSYFLREFSLFERVITQFRVMTNYLYNIFFPKVITEGAYTDGYNLSNSLFDPITTILSIIFIILVIVFSWLLRERNPLISFSIFFFFVAHVLESTIIPLELYYEHRNYIPMFFLFLPFVLLLNILRKKSKLFNYPMYSIILLLLFITFLKTNLWGDNYKLHQITMNNYPSSTRAITMMAIQYEEKNDLLNSFKTLKKGIEINNAFEIKINYLNILCSGKILQEQHLIALYKDSKVVKMTRTSIPPFNVLLSNVLNNNCGIGNPIQNSKILLKVLEENSFEKNITEKPNTYIVKAQIEFRLKNFISAKNYFVKSFYWDHDFNNLFFVTSDFLSEGENEMALEIINIGWSVYLDDFKYSVDWFDYKQTFYEIRSSIEANILNK
jgi:hypothetical protein